jgi:hypothetical protein
LANRYDLKVLFGVTAVGDHLLDGSAMQYITSDVSPNLKRALPYLYVYKFMRQCDSSKESASCLSLPWKVTKDDPRQLFIPLTHSIGFAERMYDNPLTHVGPSVDEIVMPLHVHLKKV